MKDRYMISYILKATTLCLFLLLFNAANVPLHAQEDLTTPVENPEDASAEPAEGAAVEAEAVAETEEPTDAAPESATLDGVIEGLTEPAEDAAAETPASTEATPDKKLQALREQNINPSEIPSLLFTYWEHAALMDAKKTRGVVRAPTDNELSTSLEAPTGASVAPVVEPGIRELTLGGIVFTNGADWTIWLNNTQVTPKALPRQAIDLVVRKEYVDIKWYDEYTNQIFPVRLRPHQRFNLDTRIFLPGEG